MMQFSIGLHTRHVGRGYASIRAELLAGMAALAAAEVVALVGNVANVRH